MQPNQRPRLGIAQLAGELLAQRFLPFFWWAIDMRDPVEFLAHLGLGNGANLRAVRERALIGTVVDDGYR